MRHRVLMALTMALVLVPMSGCPAATPMTLGIWLVHYGSDTYYNGLEFFANGNVGTFNSGPFPYGATGWFEGIFNWQKNGNTVTIFQDLSGTIYTFVGTLQNSTFMTGEWTDPNDPNNPVPFTATKAPTELISPP